MEAYMKSLSGSLQNLSNLQLINRREADLFLARKKSFGWVHVGNTTIRIGEMLDYIKGNEKLFPPRTGHLGNWEEIVQGRSGMMDFNKSICANGYGRPLLYCFNQTEDQFLQSGDWVYLPGSIIEKGNRKELELYTWNGNEFIKRNRDKPYFTPFVQTILNQEFYPLVLYHQKKLEGIDSFHFTFETSIILRNETLVRKIIKLLVTEAIKRSNVKRALSDLFSHHVSLSGDMVRTHILFDGEGFEIQDDYFKNIDELIDAAMLPIYAVEYSQDFFRDIANMPKGMPLISNLLSGIISAILESHYQSQSPEESKNEEHINFHFHWGARAMAGYPPIKKGYFSEKSTIRSYRQIFDTIVSGMDEIKPTFFVLLPSVIFSLWPTDKHIKDQELLSHLFQRIRILTNSSLDDLNFLQKKIKEIVSEWLELNQAELSSYFLNRFRKHSGILSDIPKNFSSEPVEPHGFRDLTFRQACMIVGVLHQSLQ